MEYRDLGDRRFVHHLTARPLTRFDSDHVAWLQRFIKRDGVAIMHIETYEEEAT